MSRTTKRHWFTSRTLLLLFAALVVVIAVLIWRWERNESPAVSSDAVEAEAIGENAGSKSSASQKPSPSKTAEQTTQATEHPPTTLDVFSPERVIGNPECIVSTGYGQAEGLAVVILPEADGARFAVLDGAGVVFDGELPFSHGFVHIGRQPNGSVLVGFDSFRWGRGADEPVDEDAWGRPSNASRPVRVYLDGQIIFESDKVSDFDVARDGSSFFVIEPLASGVSNLRIHNLERGFEEHYPLDQIGPYENPRSRYTAYYAKSQTEVHLAHDFFDAMQWFYPVDGGTPRVRKMDGIIDGVFASSRHGYFVRWDEDRDEMVIFKREFQHDGTGESTGTDLWSRTLDLDEFWAVWISHDEAWLVLNASNLHMLNAATGETVFAFPTKANLSRLVDPDASKDFYTHLREMYEEAAFKRLASVLPDDSRMGSSHGTLQVRGGLLIMGREITQPMSGHPGRGTKKYIHHVAWEIYDMSELQIDSQPKMHIEFDTEIDCASGIVPGRGLQEVDGRLTYLTERLTFDSD